MLGRVPRRRRRDQPVTDDPEVEGGVDQRRRAREAVAVSHEHVDRGAVRNHEPDPVRPGEQLLGDGGRSGRRQTGAGAGRPGSSPKPRMRSTDDRVVDLHARLRAARDRRWASHTSRRMPTSAAPQSRRRARVNAGPRRRERWVLPTPRPRPRGAAGVAAGARPGRRLRRRRAPTPRLGGLSTGAQCGRV